MNHIKIINTETRKVAKLTAAELPQGLKDIHGFDVTLERGAAEVDNSTFNQITSTEDNTVNDNQSVIDKYLRENGLNYEVKTYQERNPFTGKLLDSYGTYRDDTKEVFQTGFSKRYQTIQNRAGFEAIADFAEHQEIKLVNAGTWNNGAEAFVQIDLNGGLAVGGNPDDTVAQRITFYNSHNGNSSFRLFITPFRFFCKNQLGVVEGLSRAIQGIKVGDITKGLKIPHTAFGEERLRIIAEQFEIVDGAFKAINHKYNELAATPIKEETVAEVLNRLYPVDKKASDKAQKSAKERQAKIRDFVSDADGGFIAWNTAWNLYNAITRYTTHEQGGFTNKEKALLVGHGQDLNKSAFDTIAEVCGL